MFAPNLIKCICGDVCPVPWCRVELGCIVDVPEIFGVPTFKAIWKFNKEPSLNFYTTPINEGLRESLE